MQLSELWTTAGLFYSDSGQTMPSGQRSRITVQEIRCKEDVAALIEIAGRIGLHSVEFEESIFDELFVQGLLDSNPNVPGFHLILGWDVDWLQSILGKAAKEVLQALEYLPADQGLIRIQEHDGVTYVVVCANSPEGFLSAVRSLVSNTSVQSRKEGEFVTRANDWNAPNRDSADCYTPDRRPVNLSLHDVFTENGIYRVHQNELDPTADVSFRVTYGAIEEAIALCELAARVTLSAGHVTFPLTVLHAEESWERGARDSFSVELAEDVRQNRLYLEEDKGFNNIVISGDKVDWVRMVRKMIGSWFDTVHEPDLTTWRSRFDALSRGTHKDVNLKARVACALSEKLHRHRIEKIIIPEQLGFSPEWWKRVLPDTGNASLSIAASEPLFHKKWRDPGELDDIRRRILNYLVERSSEFEGPISIEIFTTVSRVSFQNWAEEMAEEISDHTRGDVHFLYRSAHKSALVWAMDSVLPELKGSKTIESVVLQSREYFADISQIELRQRYLQEYYPLDEIIALELGLSISNIHVELTESGAMFQIIAKDKDGSEIDKWQWDSLYEVSDYMPNQPEMGTVLIPQAGYRMFTGDHLMMTEKTPTNPERFWRWYQTEILPEVKRAGEANSESPKFSRLECVVSMDAEEVRLGIREENISILEALHEDIYFYGLHVFHEHAKKTGDDSWDAPGAILPFVNQKQDCLTASITLHPFRNTETIDLYAASGEHYALRALDEKVFKDTRIVSTTVDGKDIRVEQVPANESLGTYMRWVEGAQNDAMMNLDFLTRDRDSSDSDQLLNGIMYSREVEQWIHRNRGEISGDVVVLERSFQGRKIHLVEVYRRTKTISPKMKHALYKPTVYINARHHANEVSSTNAALLTAKSLSKMPEMLEHANVVVTPLENPDGAELHRLLTQENPFWKHHSARYNACGLEFAKHHFTDDTVFGESRVYKRVWNRWKPDVILDDHGVPSHEWIQMFSGFNSPPRFPVSYWLPIAQMYTIWYHLKNGGQSHERAFSSLRQIVTRDLQDDRITSNGNSKWLGVYEKWGNTFESEKFPLEVQNGSIIYNRPVEDGTFSDTLIARYPRFVTAELITEVDDETVYGDRLLECVHAHRVVHNSLLNWIQSAKVEIEVCTGVLPDGRTRVGINRKRPLT